MSNLFACLVHDNEPVIIDLIRNLKRFDPYSDILIYKGKNVEVKDYFLNDVSVYPTPKTIGWGHLGLFVYDCLKYVVENNYSSVTIVDSDQLLVKDGYSEWVNAVLRHNDIITGRIAFNRDNYCTPLVDFSLSLTKSAMAQKAFGEYQDNALCSCFNPGTVYSRKFAEMAVEKLTEAMIIELVDNGAMAEEEPLFVSLANVHGMTIYDAGELNALAWRREWTIEEIDNMLGKLFWVHPVKRDIDDPIRTRIRLYSRIISGF